MQSYKSEFIEFALATGVLRFGDFTLKSGRKSPYFFNAGLFNHGSSLHRLGQFYAQCILDNGLEFDVLYGAAYKGIPLVSAIAIALHTQHGLDFPWCFNRKEVKDHGEQGILVGAPLTGRILIVDDVVSAGTSVRESVAIIERAGATAVGVTVALDRQERGLSSLSAMQEVRSKLGLTTAAIISLQELLAFLRDRGDMPEALANAQNYFQEYGAIDSTD